MKDSKMRPNPALSSIAYVQGLQNDNWSKKNVEGTTDLILPSSAASQIVLQEMIITISDDAKD